MKFFFTGIWARLLLAFSTIAGITVIAGVMALLIFEYSGELVESITERNVPEVVQVAEFAEIGGEIIALAPRLLSATDDKVRTVIQNDIFRLLLRINEQIELLDIASIGFRTEVEKLASILKKNLMALLVSVTDRLELQKQLNRKIENLRWLYADLIGEVDPLNQDYAYNLDAELERLIDGVKHRDRTISATRFQTNRQSKETIEKIRSNGVLLVSLLSQASASNGLDQIINLAALSGDTIALLRYDIRKLDNDASSLTLKQVLDGIFVLAEGTQSIFTVRTDIIEGEIKGQEILSKNSIYVSQLRNLIDEIITKTQADILAAVENSKKTLERARWLLMGMVFSSLVIAGSVLWFYVRGSIVARLVALSTSMQAIAGGDLSYKVPEAGRDEIGQMAAALRIFRDTALAVEEANAQAIIDNAAVGLVIADPDGAIHFFNPMATALFAADAEDMIGGSLYSIVADEERQTFADACDSVLGREEESDVLYTFTGLRSDGTSFPIDISISGVQQRKRRRLMITVHDVTEREQAEQLLKKRVREKTDHLSRINVKLHQEIRERRRAQNELIQAGKLAALGQLAAGIAHEMNQPLSAIRYYLHNANKLLERKEIEIHKENLAKVGELIERMAKMISHLKRFARWRTDKLTAVDVVPVIEHALALVKAKLKKNSVQLYRQFSTTPKIAYGDPIRLEQVFVNIISNGIDAVSEQPIEKRELIIEVNTSEDAVEIDIVDNGPGIPTGNLDAIFDPFFTTKEVGKGLGLGLSISYNIIKGFGGSVIASSEKGGLTRFSISLQKIKG